jgi:aldehyde dehydrogenase (NAD+)
MIKDILVKLGVNTEKYNGADIIVHSPINGEVIGNLRINTREEIEQKILNSYRAFDIWKDVPAPKRGELVRLYAQELRRLKEPLAQLVTIECGKVIEEGRGEVQEMIDICEFAVGLSRQLYGLTIASERLKHVMQENWLPLGVVGVISAFNFPVAVWCWNAAIALVCGDPVIWKPSEKTPITAIVCQEILLRVIKDFSDSPMGLSELIIGRGEQGRQLVDDKRVALISATGSTRMGQEVGPKVASRFGRSLLELGGNNAVIVTENADMELALRAILFGAVATCGQRCTTIRRVFIARNSYSELVEKLKIAYKSIAANKIGNPLDSNTIIGPLIDEQAFAAMQNAIASSGGKVLQGGRVFQDKFPKAYYVEPCLVEMTSHSAGMLTETFAPILYLMPYDTLEQAIILNNSVSQGLSSAIFTKDIREAELFRRLSDTGICNVNIGTSGAEIGGAFGGEKETGGGREAGSDSWKQYMRRQTSTIYYGTEPPALAQGVKFSIT